MVEDVHNPNDGPLAIGGLAEQMERLSDAMRAFRDAVMEYRREWLGRFALPRKPKDGVTMFKLYFDVSLGPENIQTRSGPMQRVSYGEVIADHCREVLDPAMRAALE